MNQNTIINLIFMFLMILFLVGVILTNSPNTSNNIVDTKTSSDSTIMSETKTSSDSIVVSETIYCSIKQKVELYSFIENTYFVNTKLLCYRDSTVTMEYWETDKCDSSDLSEIKSEHIKEVDEIINKLKNKYGEQNIVVTGRRGI